MASLTTPQPKKKNLLKFIFNGILFLSLTALAIYYVLRDDPVNTFKMLGKARFLPILYAVAAFFVTLRLDGTNILSLTRRYKKDYKYREAFVNVLSGQTLGVYRKSAAPLIQTQTFSKQEVPPGKSASILTRNFLMFQFSLFIYSIIFFLVGYPTRQNVPLDLFRGRKLRWVVIVGLCIQMGWLSGALAVGFLRPLHRFVLNTGVNRIIKLRLTRNGEELRKKWTRKFVSYRIERKRLFHNKKLRLHLFLDNFIKQWIFGTIPFFALRAVAGNDVCSADRYFKTIVGTAYTNIIGSIVNVGGPEIVFQDTFTYFLSSIPSLGEHLKGMVSATNIFWRAVTFYRPFLIGLITTLVVQGSKKRRERIGDTRTIYDREIRNYDEFDEATKQYLNDVRKKGESKNPALLSKEEVAASFDKRKQKYSEREELKPEEEFTDDDFEKILEKEKHHLAKAEKEAEKIRKEGTVDPEIKKEADKELLAQEKKAIEKETKKQARIAKKLEKRKDNPNIEERVSTSPTKDPKEQ